MATQSTLTHSTTAVPTTLDLDQSSSSRERIVNCAVVTFFTVLTALAIYVMATYPPPAY